MKHLNYYHNLRILVECIRMLYFILKLLTTVLSFYQLRVHRFLFYCFNRFTAIYFMSQSLIFTARAYARTVLGVVHVILSVRLSVRLSVTRVDCDNLNGALQIFWYRTKGQSLCYSDTNSGWWATLPSLRNLHSKWPTPFEKRQLR